MDNDNRISSNINKSPARSRLHGVCGTHWTNIALCFGIQLTLVGCFSNSKSPSSTQPAQLEIKAVKKSSLYFEKGFEAPDQLSPVLKNTWNLSLPGLPTDLVLSQNGQSLWVATVPDPEDPSKTGLHLLRISPAGKKITSLRVKQQIKSLVLSDNGDLLVLNNYFDEMMGLSPLGKKLWEVRATCKPLLLGSGKERKIVCHHDDDAKPEISFELRDAAGEFLGEHKAGQDALLIQAFSDHQILQAFPGGKLEQVDVASSIKKQSQVQIKGEILDVSLHAANYIVVLSRIQAQQKVSSHITVLESQTFKLVNEWDYDEVTDQVESAISKRGLEVVLYGNSKRSGQLLAGFVQTLPGAGRDLTLDLTLEWTRREARPSAYNHQLVYAGSGVVVALEESSSESRRSFAVGYHWDGSFHFGVPLPAKDAAYVYTLAFDPARGLLVAATDDAFVRGYQLMR